MKKFIVLVICALIGMLSIPHVTLWNFSLGSETTEAATQLGITEGSSCKKYSGVSTDDFFDSFYTNGQIRCGFTSPPDTFYKIQCRFDSQGTNTKWTKTDAVAFTSQDACAFDCKNTQYCTEPRLVVWAQRGGLSAPQIPDGSTTNLPDPNDVNDRISIETRNENPNQNNLDRSVQHVIKYQIVRGANKFFNSQPCTIDPTGCGFVVSNLQEGDIVQYWSEMTFAETNDASAYIRAPSPPSYQRDYKYFTISGQAPTTPSPSSGTLNIAANPSPPTAGSTVQLIATTTNVKTADVQSHVINWEMYQGTAYKGGQRNIQCDINYPQQTYPGCSIPVRLQAGWNGYELRFSSQLTFKSGTGLSPLDSSTQRVTISSTTSPTPGTGLTVSESPINLNVGQAKSVTISGGTPPYILPPFVSTYAMPAISGSSLIITGVADGTSTFTLGDGAGNSVDVSVTVGSGTPPPGGGTTSGGMTYTVTPSSPTTNNLVTIQFLSVPSTVTSLDFQMIDPQSGVPGFTPPRVFQGVCPPSCQATFTPSKVGTYHFNIKAKAGNSEVASIIGGSVDVAASGTTPGTGTGYCCAVRNGNGFTYDTTITTQDACTQANGIFGNTCTNAQSIACSQYCTTGGFGNTGTCNPATSGATALSFQNICLNPVTPCVCQGTATQNAANVPCESACYTGSSVGGYLSPTYSASASSLPVGVCTNNPQYLFLAVGTASAATTSGTTYNQQPRALGMAGQHGCNSDETCWCTYVNTASFTANKPATAATLPGTQTAGTWRHPNDITASAPTATPNDHDCSAASNATITASLGIAGTTQTSGTSSTAVSRLIQAGETVTITGKVTKMSDTCKGYKYTCTTMQQLGCESHNRVLWTSLSYKDCPSGTTQIQGSAQGEGRHANWRLIAAAAVIAVTWGAAAAAAGPITSAFYTGQSVQGAVFAGAVTSGIGAAVDGSRCGTNQQGVGAGVATTMYNMWQAANARQCSNLRQNNCGSQAGCTWNGNQCVTRSGTTTTSTTGNGFEGNSCSSDSNCAAGFACNSGASGCACTSSTLRPGSCGHTGGTIGSPSGTGVNMGCVNPGEVCVDDNSCYGAGSSYNECWENGAQGVCCLSGPTGGATAKPTIDVTGNAVANPTLPVTGMNVPTYAGGTVPTDGLLLPPASSGAAAASSAYAPLAGAGTSMALNYLPTCPTADEIIGCFSVCGKTYETQIAASPLCNQGGPVIGFTAATYPCVQGTCGAYDNKRVKIDIRGPDGLTVIEDYVTTDSLGDFSYTFQAPAADGEFTAIVSVPKD
ncbi:MAG: hypothetical protein AABX14_02835 [Candidatus Aenigmatarchaeota archaeon]